MLGKAPLRTVWYKNVILSGVAIKMLICCLLELVTNQSAINKFELCSANGNDFYMHVFLISASEPNLKVRSALKQKVMERRITQSPILRRRDKGFLLKRKTPLSSMYNKLSLDCWNFQLGLVF